MVNCSIHNSTSFRQSEREDFKFGVAAATPKWEMLNLDLICLRFSLHVLESDCGVKKK